MFDTVTKGGRTFESGYKEIMRRFKEIRAKTAFNPDKRDFGKELRQFRRMQRSNRSGGEAVAPPAGRPRGDASGRTAAFWEARAELKFDARRDGAPLGSKVQQPRWSRAVRVRLCSC